MGEHIFDHNLAEELNATFNAMEQNHKQENESKIKRKYIVVGKGANKIVSEYEQDLKEFGDILYVAKKEPQKAIKSFVAGADLVVLIAALGGDSGSRYVREIGKVLQKLSVYTIAILVEPLLSEGREKLVASEQCFEEMQELCDCAILVQDQSADFKKDQFDELNDEVIQTIYFLNDVVDTASSLENGMEKFKFMLQQAESFKLYSVIGEDMEANIDHILDVLYEYSSLQLNMEDARVALVVLYGGKNMTASDIVEVQYNLEEMLQDKAELFFCTMMHEEAVDYFEIDILLGTHSYKKKTKIPYVASKTSKNKLKFLREKSIDEALLNALSLSQLCMNLLLQNNTTQRNEVLQQLEKLNKDLKKLYDDERSQ